MKHHSPLGTALSHFLSDTYVLAIKLQYFHWNLTGPEFLTLHPFLGERYESLTQHIDELAERMRALGMMAPGTMKAYLALKTIDEAPESVPHAQNLLPILVSDYDHLIKAAHTLNHLATDAHDEVTADLCLSQQSAYEKVRWMLHSTLS
ncbi:MAG: DNA starvation/stationary phase protection protein [Pseudomonadota bacterium]